MSLVVGNALCKCSFGAAPSALGVLPINLATGCSQPAANIQDAVPFVNIKPFGVCMSLANPAVATATTAALGVLTPQPCTPVTTAWAPGCPTVMLKDAPALDQESIAPCSFAGIVALTFPGEVTIQIP